MEIRLRINQTVKHEEHFNTGPGIRTRAGPDPALTVQSRQPDRGPFGFIQWTVTGE